MKRGFKRETQGFADLADQADYADFYGERPGWELPSPKN